MNDSSSGSAAPKNRSINVGANLLDEWISEQARLRQEIGRYGALLAASLLLAATVVPTLWRVSADSSRQAAKLRQGVKLLDEQLEITERARKAAGPGLVVKAMRDRTGESFDRLMTQMNRVLSAGNARTALTSLRCDIQGGEAHLVVQADSEEDGAADAFARDAGEVGSKVDAIVNSRPSRLLGPQGLGFQYEKRIGVDR